MRLGIFIVGVMAAVSAAAQVVTDDLQDRAVEWTQEYLRVNTVNPPGNEIAGARFLASIFDAEGITYEMVESAPGRGNIWARLNGGDEPGLLLLHHIDVVPADPWFTEEHGPFEPTIKGGKLYGRGSCDMKGSVACMIAAAEQFAAADLKKPVYITCTADEEVGYVVA